MSQDSQDCPISATAALSIDLVLHQIFRHLDPKDLLQLSLVNMSWRNSARSALRSKRCLAFIEGADPCNELQSLNDTISRSSGTPYSGLAMNYPKSRSLGHFLSCVPLDITHAYSSILQVKYRHLEIKWYECTRACAAEDLQMHIFKEKGKDLVELKIFAIPYHIDSLGDCSGIEYNHWLPNLKVLDVPYKSAMLPSVVRELIQAAPQLEKWFACSSSADLDFLLQISKASAVTEFIFQPNFHSWVGEQMLQQRRQNFINKIMKFAAAAPKLRKLDVKKLRFYFGGTTGKLAEESLKQLLKGSSSSLEEVRILNLDLAVMLLLKPLKPLMKVRTLKLYIESVEEENLVFGHPLQVLNWVRWFPGLETVYIRVAGLLPLTDVSGQLWSSIRFSPCSSVRKIIMSQSVYADNFLEFEYRSHLSYLFPNVREIRVNEVPSKLENVLKLLWKWPHAETITLKSVNVKGAWYNKDSVFCGITKKQARCYVKESAASLRKIVLPEHVSGSLLSLKRLKQFRMEFIHWECRNLKERKRGIPHSGHFFLSHVTGVLAFSRMPELKVEVVTCSRGCAYNLEHLRPFVSLTERKEKEYRWEFDALNSWE